MALIGTAVAFILSFQNNATYGRIWEARKIWGGIVNTSRAWAIMVNDFVVNDFNRRGFRPQPASAGRAGSHGFKWDIQKLSPEVWEEYQEKLKKGEVRDF